MRKIYLTGEVDYGMYTHFSKQLDHFCASSHNPIEVDICSEGGDGEIGMAIYGKMQAAPCLIYATAYGEVQSAASVILIGADYRSTALETWFMTHDAPELEKCKDKARRKQLERQEEQWAEVFAKHSALSAAEWRKLSKKTTYLNPAEMLQYGVVDRILKGSKNVK